MRMRLESINRDEEKKKIAQVLFHACSMQTDFPLNYCKKAEGHQPGGPPYAPHITMEKRHHSTLARSKKRTLAPPYLTWGQAPVVRTAVDRDMRCECTDFLY